MSAKTPLRVVFDGSNNATGLAEFQSGEFIALSAGGLGASLSIGSAGQVLKVNSGASALEFGNVEAVFNIDGMTDGTSITLADGDVFAISDGGTEKRITASQIKTYVASTAGSTAITSLDIDGGTDIGAALADADLLIVDDGAGGTNRKMAASRIKTYVADITLTTAAQTNITSVGTLTSLSVDNVIVNGTTIGHTDDTDLITLADGVLTVAGEVDAVSLDVSGNVDIDGTLEADAITIGGVTLAETISDTVGAMVTSNTETGVTVTYDDSDNTLDFVIGTLNQDTTGNAATATTLATARTIAGQSFDGSANITIASTDLSNTSNITLNDATQTLTNKTLTSPTIDTITRTGNFTVDASNDIILDTDGGVLNLKDGGTEFARFVNASGTGVTLRTAVSDEDLFIQGNDGGSTITAIQLDMSDAGTAIFNKDIKLGDSGKVELGASGDLRLYHDGSNSYVDDVGTGALIVRGSTITLDSAGNITLDAGGSSINLSDDGTQFGALAKNGNDLRVISSISDGDIVFRGNDGGSFLNALTLDMSNAGAATFNNNVTVGGDLIVNGTTTTVNSTTVTIDDPIFTLGGDSAPSSDDNKDRGIEFRYHTGSAAKVGFFGYDDSASAFTFIADATNSSEVFSGSAGDVVFGSITGTTLNTNEIVSSGITINDSGNINLDADAGSIFIKDNGTVIIKMGNDGSSNAQFKSNVSDKDILFKGNDGAAEITALTLDMSEAGAATFNDKVILGANKSIEFGDSGETISGDGTNLTVASSGVLTLDAAGDIQLDAGGADVEFLDDSTSFLKISNSSSDVHIRSIVQDKDILLRGNDGGSQITALTLDMSDAGSATFNNHVTLGNSKELRMGASGDDIVFDGTNLLITATNGLILDGDQQILLNDGGVNYAAFVSSSTRFTIHGQRSDKDFAINVNDGGTQIDALLIDASEAGAATFNSTVTANAGLKADNITIDGTEIDLSSGDLTIDVAGDLNIDAGGGDIFLKDDGTTFAALRKESNGQLQIQSGSGPTTVLTFDSAQKATFASNIAIGDNIFLHSDASEIRFGVNSDVTLAHVHDTGLLLNANRQLQFGDAGENISGDGTDLTIASSNKIILNADGAGQVFFKDGGTNLAKLFVSSQVFTLETIVSDGDFAIKGNDGGSSVTALSLDMSEAGAATFNDKITLAANKTIEFGDSGETISGDGTDLTIASSADVTIDAASEINLDAGSDSIRIKDDGTEYGRIHRISGGGLVLKSQESNKDIQFQGVDGGSSITALTLDMSEAGAATFNDNVIMGTNKEVQFVDTNESIKSDGSKLIIKSGGTTFNFPTADGDADQVLTTDGSGTLSFAAAGGAGSGFSESTITTLPGQEGNFDLAKTNNAGSAESGLTAGGTDSFGVALGSVYTMMEPVGASTTNNTDLGSSESHVGA